MYGDTGHRYKCSSDVLECSNNVLAMFMECFCNKKCDTLEIYNVGNNMMTIQHHSQLYSSYKKIQKNVPKRGVHCQSRKKRMQTHRGLLSPDNVDIEWM